MAVENGKTPRAVSRAFVRVERRPQVIFPQVIVPQAIFHVEWRSPIAVMGRMGLEAARQ